MTGDGCQAPGGEYNQVYQVYNLSPVELVEGGAEEAGQGVGEALPGRVHLRGWNLGSRVEEEEEEEEEEDEKEEEE